MFVPIDTAVVYDGRQWYLAPAPPQWFLEATDAGADELDSWFFPERVSVKVEPCLADDDGPLRWTSCRPGAGPCRRRHRHRSRRRAAA